MLRYGEIELLEFLNAGCRKRIMYNFTLADLFKSSTIFPLLISHLYSFFTPFTNHLEIQFPFQLPELCRLRPPSFSACCFLAAFAFAFSACFSCLARVFYRYFSACSSVLCWKMRRTPSLCMMLSSGQEEVSA